MNCRLRTRLAEAAVVVLSLVVVSGKPAHAYIDPGTGSYVLQVVVASVLAALFVVKSTWRNIKGAVGKCFVKRTKDDQ